MVHSQVPVHGILQDLQRLLQSSSNGKRQDEREGNLPCAGLFVMWEADTGRDEDGAIIHKMMS